ncbi:MAG: hypothetical protein AVDCRST_MAG18-1992, partial [uncultured Thermomicrobiales bacterium]
WVMASWSSFRPSTNRADGSSGAIQRLMKIPTGHRLCPA